MAADALGNPVRMILTGGQVHDISQAETLVRDLPADRVIADKGYDSSASVATVEAAGAEAVIPSRSNRKEPASTTPTCTGSGIKSSGCSAG